MSGDKLLRPKEAMRMIGVSRTTLHRIEKSDSTFPSKIHISARCVGWRESDLAEWLKSREVAE